MTTRKTYIQNYYNCTITIIKGVEQDNLFEVSHNLSGEIFTALNIIDAYKAAKLLDLEYKVAELYNNHTDHKEGE